MSDTSGPSDLQNDMPALGPQTGNVRGPPMQLPSALQGLAKFFQQNQSQPSQGRPGPQLQPKPPALTEVQANQPPQHIGRPASFAPVPANVPVPTGGYTPYLPTVDKRDISQWGDTAPFPRLPATFELHGLFNRIGQHFAQSGGQTGDLASQLSGHSEAYIDAFMKAQDWKMKVEKEGQAIASAKLEESVGNRLIDYRTTIAAYRDAGGPHKLLNGVNLYDALYADALKDDDKKAQAMFEAGEPLEHIENYMHDADKVLRDLKAARQKASDQDDTDAAYGLAPREGASNDPTWSAEPVAAGQSPAAAPADGQPKPDDTLPEAIKALPPEYRNPLLVNAGTEMFRGVAPAGEMSKNGMHHARVIADQLGVETGKILNDPNLKPGQYVDAVRKRLGPGIAAELESVEDYTNPALTTGTGSGKQAEFLRQLQDIAHKDAPGDAAGRGAFNAANFALQKDFKDNRGQVQNVLTRTGDMASQLRNIHTDMDRLQKELKAQGISPNSLHLQGILDLGLGTGVANRLMSDLEAYAAAYDYIVSSGHSTLGGREAFSKYFNIYKPLSTIRDTLKGHVPSTEGILQGVHTRWEGIGGKKTNMPGIDSATEKEIHDYGKMDTVTGALPYDPSRDNDIFLKKAGPWGAAGRYYWTGDSQERDDPSNWKRVE